LASALCAACLAAPCAQANLSLSSTFDTSDEGWTVSQDGQPSEATAPIYQSQGGNPDGNIGFADSDLDELITGCCYAYFESPPSWSGDGSQNYGGTVSFDALGSLDGDPGLPPIVVIYGGGLASFPDQVTGRLCSKLEQTTSPAWQTFSIPLTAENWSDCEGNPVSVDDFEAVMSNLAGVFISTDDSTLANEVENIDNVSVGGGGDPPANEVARTLALSYVKPQASLQGTLSAPGDSSCASGQKVQVFRRKRGHDPKAGTATTDSGGAFAVAAHNKPGTYYAKAPESAPSPTLSCLAAKSPRVRIAKRA
jgi:laminin B (domain IV)